MPAARSPHQLPAARSRQRWPRTTGLAAGLLATAAAVLTPGRADALLVFTIRQVGNDVVVSGGGSYTTAGLIQTGNSTPADFPNNTPYNTTDTNPFTPTSGWINGGFNTLLTGSGPLEIWESPLLDFSGPSSLFGIGNGDLSSSSSTGDPFGIDEGYLGDPNYSTSFIYLPAGRTCDPGPCTLSTSTSTYFGQTIANLGLTPGIYTWKWGAGGINETFQLNIEAPGPLPALGAASAFAWSRKLRRRIKGCSTRRAALTS